MLVGKRVAVVQKGIQLCLRVFHQISVRTARGVDLVGIALRIESLVEILHLV